MTDTVTATGVRRVRLLRRALAPVKEAGRCPGAIIRGFQAEIGLCASLSIEMVLVRSRRWAAPPRSPSRATTRTPAHADLHGDCSAETTPAAR
jgi:hypothetical protein